MHTLQGIITKTAANAGVQFDSLGYVSTNVSNYNTNGYKLERFENYLADAGYLGGKARRDMSIGSMYKTDNPLDVALEKQGFLVVTKPNGDIAYTRDGGLRVNKDGYLTTADGSIVSDGIKIPTNYHRLKILETGEVQVVEKLADDPKTVGHLALANFPNPEKLQLTDGNHYLETEQSGKAEYLAKVDFVKQGHSEKSNVNLYEEVNTVLRLNASIIASTRLIKAVDDIYRQSINLRQ